MESVVRQWERQNHAEIGAWRINAGLLGIPEPELLREFCERAGGRRPPAGAGCRARVRRHAAPDLSRAAPSAGGAIGSRKARSIEYGRTSEGGEAAAQLAAQPILPSGRDRRRRCCAAGSPTATRSTSPSRRSSRAERRDRLPRVDPALRRRGPSSARWIASTPPGSTDAPDGFTDDAGRALSRAWCRRLALAIKCASLARIAGTLVETYLGRDAGPAGAGRPHLARRRRPDRRRAVVLRPARLHADHRHARRPTQIIPLLNDYAEAIISSIHDAGGDVLKLIGDGTLAIFRGRRSRRRLPLRAPRPKRTPRERVAGAQRAPRRGRAAVTAGLSRPPHRRGVLRQYRQRGPARLHGRRPGRQRGRAASPSMCRSVDRDVLLSSAFVAAATRRGARTARLGRPLRAARRRARAGAVHAGTGSWQP